LTPSSTASSTCRIDWRPSRWLLSGLVVLGMLAAVSVLMSALPQGPALLSALAAITWAGRLVWREARRPPTVLWMAGQGASVQWHPDVPPEPLRALHWHLRGPLAVLKARDHHGRRHCFSWWPDTLPAATRRQLRLFRDLSSRYDKPLPSVAA
jgi:toxin CptA